jgi:hypothetical protein
MASHVYHGDLPGYDPEAILHDGCPECDDRAKRGLDGLCELDHGNFVLLWRRMLNTEYSRGGGDDAGRYRSDCERRLGHQLYLMGVLLERHAITPIWSATVFREVA